MTSGGIPVNHCQGVLNKQRTVVLRVHEKSIKALKCDRGGTDARSHVQERWTHKRRHSGRLINKFSLRRVHNTFGHL